MKSVRSGRVALLDRASMNGGERAFDEHDREELERLRAIVQTNESSDAIVAALTETTQRQDRELVRMRWMVRALRLVLWTLWPWRVAAKLLRKARR